VFATAHRLHEAGLPYAMVSVIRALAPASAKPGDKAVVTADGALNGWVGGGCALPAVIRTVRAALSDGRARLIRIAPSEEGHENELGDVLEFGMRCQSGGTLELFVDPILPPAQLVIVGTSAVALSLVRLAPHLGFTVICVAEGGFEAATIAEPVRVIQSDDPAVAKAQIAPGAWVVVATQGRRDIPGLRLALSLEARHIAFVASAKKASVIRDSLVASGSDASAVAAIAAPAGYPMPATTPEEIALSVLAAVVAHRRGTQSKASGDCEEEHALSSTTVVRQGATAAEGVKASPASAAASAKSSCCGG
jgi:xanthine dehydrogenase accessory factor